ncbi:MAG: hypothetical protein U1A78_13995 [Polyangia bacterium]
MRSRVMPGAPLVLLGLLGCEPAPLDRPTPPPSTEQPAVLHFVQGAFALPKIELLIDKQAYATLDFRQAKGSITLPAGEHEIALRAPGAGSTLFTSGLVLQQGQRLLLLSRWTRDEKGAKVVTVQAEPLGLSDPAGVKLRLLHASEGAPDFDGLSKDGKTLFEAVGAGSVSPYATLAGDIAAMTPVRLRQHGATFDLWRVLVPATVPKGTALTALAIGDSDPLAGDAARFRVAVLNEASGALTDLPTDPSSEGPKGALGFLHVSPDAPALDVLAPSGMKLAQNLSYQRASMLSELVGGTYELTVQESVSGKVQRKATLRLLPGQTLMLPIHGLIAADSMTPLGLLALPRPVQGGTWRVANLVPGAPAFDVKLSNHTVVQGVAYPSAMAPQSEDLPSGTFQFLTHESRVPGWQTTVDDATAMQVVGSSVSILVAGSLTNGLKPPTALLIVDSQASTMTPPSVRLLPTTLP